MDKTRHFMTNVLHKSPFTAPLIRKVRIVSGDGTTTTYEMQVEKEHCNLAGTLHGGMTSTLVDVFTAAAVGANIDMDKKLLLSVDVKVRFLSPAKLGDTILMNARTLRAGRTLAFAEVDIIEKLSQRLVAQGSQILYVTDKMSRDFKDKHGLKTGPQKMPHFPNPM